MERLAHGRRAVCAQRARRGACSRARRHDRARAHAAHRCRQRCLLARAPSAPRLAPPRSAGGRARRSPPRHHGGRLRRAERAVEPRRGPGHGRLHERARLHARRARQPRGRRAARRAPRASPELEATCLGTNVRGFEPALPVSEVVSVCAPGPAGRAVRVGLVGVVMDDPTAYRRPPFGGVTLLLQRRRDCRGRAPPRGRVRDRARANPSAAGPRPRPRAWMAGLPRAARRA